MTTETIDQVVSNLQEKQKVLRRRIAHLGLLVGQIKEEISRMHDEMPDKLNNSMHKLTMQLENAMNALAYLVSTQEDLDQQKQNETLTIEEDNHDK